MSFTSAAITIYELLPQPVKEVVVVAYCGEWLSLRIVGHWVVVWRGVSPSAEDLDTPGALAGVVKWGGSLHTSAKQDITI